MVCKAAISLILWQKALGNLRFLNEYNGWNPFSKLKVLILELYLNYF